MKKNPSTDEHGQVGRTPAAAMGAVTSAHSISAALACGLVLAACTATIAVREEPLPDVCDPYLVESPDQQADSDALSRSETEPRADRYYGSQSRPVLIENAVVMTAAGDRFDPGYVLFEDGRITAVGGGGMTPTDPDTWVIDATGRYVTPGLIDTHSHLGVYPAPHVAAHSDGNEATSPVTADVQAIHSIWPQDPGFMRAVAGGITSLQILPGSANLIGGRGVTLKLHRGARVPEEMRFPDAPDGIKMACGENPKRVYGERGSSPSTRMASVAVVRATFLEAQRYRESREDHREALQDWCEEPSPESDEPPDPPDRNLSQETLVGVLDGDILVHIHCYRADEMLVQIELAEEFGYQIRSFHHAVEAYKIRDVLADMGIATSTWADWWGFKIEAYDAILENAALLTESSARAIIHSDSSVGIQRLNQEAAKAYYAGVAGGVRVTEDEALRWITLNPAWALGVDDQTGSLEVGKMADIVIWSGHPFSVYSQAELVFIDGLPEFDINDADEPWSDFELGQWPEMNQ